MADLNIDVSDAVIQMDWLVPAYGIDSFCFDSIGVNGAIVQIVDIAEQGVQKIVSNILFPRVFLKVPIKRIFDRSVLNIMETIPRKRIFATQKI